MTIYIKGFQQKDMKRRLNEEITKGEIRSIVSSELSDFLKDRDFEKRVKEISAIAMEKFFKMMYNRRNFWKSEVTNG